MKKCAMCGAEVEEYPCPRCGYNDHNSSNVLKDDYLGVTHIDEEDYDDDEEDDWDKDDHHDEWYDADSYDD
jgi:transposase